MGPKRRGLGRRGERPEAGLGGGTGGGAGGGAWVGAGSGWELVWGWGVGTGRWSSEGDVRDRGFGVEKG